MQQLPKFTAKSLIDIFETLAKGPISSRDMKVRINDPLSVLIYQQIMSLEIKDIEEVKDKWGEGNFYAKSKYIKNPLLFAAFLEKKHKWNQVLPEIKWLLNTITAPSPELFENIYFYSDVIKTPKRMGENEVSKSNRLASIVINHCHYLDTDEKNTLFDEYLNKYGKSHQDEIIEILIRDFPHYQFDTLLKKTTHFFTENKINFNKNYPLDCFLPKHSDYNPHENFFISSSHSADINKFLENGFQFNPNYRFNNTDLFNCIIESTRWDLICSILPHLEIPKLTENSVNVLNKYPKYALFYEDMKIVQINNKLNAKLENKASKSKFKI